MTRRHLPRHCGPILALAIASVVPGVTSRSEADQPLAIHAAALIDVVNGRVVRDVVVVVEAGRIAFAGRRSAAPIPRTARRLELTGATLLPGLIDAHVHLTIGGDPETNARTTLHAGFTTVQDLGAHRYENVRLRNAINEGRIVGPRVVASGPWLGVSGGTCDFEGIGVRGAAAFRQRVREDIPRGVDLIKVCVSGWVADAVREPKRYEITDSELSAAIDEAHKFDRRVAVHAISSGGVSAAVANGADLVAHAGFPLADTVETMRDRQVHLVSTLFSLRSRAAVADVTALESHLQSAYRAGLPLAFGTDAGVIPHGQNFREFEHLTRIGMSKLEAIRAATTVAADAVGLKGRAGVLERGAFADVIAVEGNPLTELEALRRIRFVMKDGEVQFLRSAF